MWRNVSDSVWILSARRKRKIQFIFFIFPLSLTYTHRSHLKRLSPFVQIDFDVHTKWPRFYYTNGILIFLTRAAEMKFRMLSISHDELLSLCLSVRVFGVWEVKVFIQCQQFFNSIKKGKFNSLKLQNQVGDNLPERFQNKKFVSQQPFSKNKNCHDILQYI